MAYFVFQNFHIIVAGFCKSIAGGAIIQRGDYKILNADDQVINPSCMSTMVRPGMTVEITIMMHRKAEANDGCEHRCPRCSHVNSKVITTSGWVTWWVPFDNYHHR